MRIDLDKMKEDIKQNEYYIETLDGNIHTFKLDLNALEKIENKLGQTPNTIFLRLITEDNLYNFLIDILEAILDIDNLDEKLYWDVPTARKLEQILIDMAWEQLDNSSVDILCDRIVKSAVNFIG